MTGDIVTGLDEAIRHAKGEDVGARVVALNPRRNRDFERGRRAAAAAKAAGRSAMDQGLEQIGATFDTPALVNALKMHVEHYIRHGAAYGAGTPMIAARYGERARTITERIARWREATEWVAVAIAIDAVEHWYRAERSANRIAAAFGRGGTLSLDVLAELRLILRWLRFTGRAAGFEDLLRIVAGGCDE